MRWNPKQVERMREQYPPGTRIRLSQMNDPYAPVPPGTEGSVACVDDACQIHMIWDNGRTLALIPGEDSFSVIPQPLQTLKLYMPLSITTYEQDEYGDLGNDPVALDPHTTLAYKDHILAAIQKERLPEEAESGLMTYYHGNDAVKQKVQSCAFTVERVQDQLMGVAECQVRGELTGPELDGFKEFLLGQVADGWGEGFEQRPIQTGDGEIYVSFWNDSPGWSIQTGQELKQPDGPEESPGMNLNM